MWTSGIDNVVVDEFKKAGVPFVPTVGADNVGFVNQLLNTKDYPGLVGAAVTNPGSVGGAGVTLALQILNGQAPDSHTVVLTPQLWDNVSDEGKAALEATKVDPSLKLSDIWPLGLQIPTGPRIPSPSSWPARARASKPKRDRGSRGVGLPAPLDTRAHNVTGMLLEATGGRQALRWRGGAQGSLPAVRPAEVHALLGANGAGKSTLVKSSRGPCGPMPAPSLFRAGNGPFGRRPTRGGLASSPCRGPPWSRTSRSARTCG